MRGGKRSNETEFPRQVHSQTEFGNEGMATSLGGHLINAVPTVVTALCRRLSRGAAHRLSGAVSALPFATDIYEMAFGRAVLLHVPVLPQKTIECLGGAGALFLFLDVAIVITSFNVGRHRRHGKYSDHASTDSGYFGFIFFVFLYFRGIYLWAQTAKSNQGIASCLGITCVQ